MQDANTIDAMLSPERTARIERKVRLMAKRDEAIEALAVARRNESKAHRALSLSPTDEELRAAAIAASSRVDRLYCRVRNYARLAKHAGKAR